MLTIISLTYVYKKKSSVYIFSINKLLFQKFQFIYRKLLIKMRNIVVFFSNIPFDLLSFPFFNMKILHQKYMILIDCHPGTEGSY